MATQKQLERIQFSKDTANLAVRRKPDLLFQYPSVEFHTEFQDGAFYSGKQIHDVLFRYFDSNGLLAHVSVGPIGKKTCLLARKRLEELMPNDAAVVSKGPNYELSGRIGDIEHTLVFRPTQFGYMHSGKSRRYLEPERKQRLYGN